jgi:hypothetical protein
MVSSGLKNLQLKKVFLPAFLAVLLLQLQWKLANKAPKGSTILCMLADTAERYLSSLLFEDIEA